VVQWLGSLPIHIASRIHAEPNNAPYTTEEILNTLNKRPLTQDDINLLLDEESKIRLQDLIKTKEVSIKNVVNLEFLVPSENLKRKRIK